MVHRSIGERAQVLAALKIERDGDGGAETLGPEKLALIVMFLQHESSRAERCYVPKS
jgi:hypothetical protein